MERRMSYPFPVPTAYMGDVVFAGSTLALGRGDYLPEVLESWVRWGLAVTRQVWLLVVADPAFGPGVR
jgi:hypothetical protein